MCYNKEVSFVIALFGTVCAIKEFKKGDIISIFRGIYLLCLVLMQVNEFFLHLYNNPDTWTHQIASFCIPVIILIQVILLLTAGVVLPNVTKDLSIAVIVFGSLFMILAVYFFIKVLIPALWNKKFRSIAACKEGCRLKWDSDEKCSADNSWFLNLQRLCYMVTLCIVTYLLFGWELVVVLLTLILVAYFMMLLGPVKGRNLLGSLWCFLSVILFSCVVIMN